MREQPADDFGQHGGDGDDEARQQNRFVVGAVIVIVRRMVVVVVTVTVPMRFVAMLLVRRVLGNSDRRMASVAMHAVWLVVNGFGACGHELIIVPQNNVGGVAGERRA